MRCNSVYAEMGKRIKDSRKKNNITQAMLAEQMSVSIPYISKIENGVCGFTLAMAKDCYCRYRWDVDFIIANKRYRENPFGIMLKNKNIHERQKIIDLIVSALKIAVERHVECDKELKKKYIVCLNLVSGQYELDNEGDTYVCEDRIFYGLRKENKLTEDDMAKSLCINSRQYTNLESGQTKAKMDVLIKLSSDYGINPSFFITGKFEQLTIINEIWKMLTKDEKEKVWLCVNAGLSLCDGE